MTVPENEALLIQGGTIVTCDEKLGILERGDILVQDGRIIEVAASITAPGVEVFDASGMIVMPGLIDTHRHNTDAVFSAYGGNVTMWTYFAEVPSHYFTGEFIRRASRGASLLALNAGVTTVLDWCLSAHTLEAALCALDGYEEAGGRTIFAYGPGGGVIGQNPDLSQSPLLTDTAILRERCRESKRDLLDLWIAAMGPDFTPYETARDEILMIRELGLKATMHVGGTIVGAKGAVIPIAEAGLLGPDLQFAHCCNLRHAEIQPMAQTGVTASVSPYAEATMGMGPIPYLRLREAGVKVGLGTDSVCVTGQGLFSEGKSLLALERSRRHNETVASGSDPANNDFLTTDDVVKALTIDSADSIGIADKVGSLTPGKWADIITLDKRRLGVEPLNISSAIVLAGEPMAVRDVIVAGRFRKRDGELVGYTYNQVMDDLADVRRSAPLYLIGQGPH
ncbi:amidohydrolase family protein [Sphingobium fuliginis]|jgi:5-methylthioadenosine/S-adenosylhomocysteine deaminase|uniref:amidohydrolase family protein n=1 Tax=Sphingobium fuliginis (strain ATCC 27551) TaxID=336203 RepID=UPI0037C7610E